MGRQTEQNSCFANYLVPGHRLVRGDDLERNEALVISIPRLDQLDPATHRDRVENVVAIVPRVHDATADR
jgi:hypothetical protein